MKKLAVSILLLMATQVFPSGTSIGNGLVSGERVKGINLSKAEEKLCTDKKGQVETLDGVQVCRLKDKTTIKMKDLIEEAGKKKESGKK